MTQFTTEELNLITLYDPGNRAGTRGQNPACESPARQFSTRLTTI